MDPVTHGIAGALIGKGFFSRRHTRVALLAAIVGAVFPDVDVFVDAFSHDPLAIARYHRGFTHSFIGLPIFAAALAGLTLWVANGYRRRNGREDWAPPSFWWLFWIYAVAIASHIILDGFTSFGTRMLNPFSKDRVSWDLVFIIDFTFTALLLLPQVIAWIYKEHMGWASRASKLWGFFTVLAWGVWALARAADFAFSIRVIFLWSILFAALFFLPARNDWGVRFGRERWCRAGFAVACAYVFACGFAHHQAMNRVRAFVLGKQIQVVKIGALPLPPSLCDWNGMVLTPAGVYQSTFSLLHPRSTAFHFVANSPPNRFIEEAAQLEPVRTYLWFARFPVVRYFQEGDRHVVEYADPRFFEGKQRRPMPFTFAVAFNAAGKMLEYGWVRSAPQPGPGRPGSSPGNQGAAPSP